MSTTIIETIKKQIAALDSTATPKDIGVVTSVSDGIVEISGLEKAQMMEMVIFATGKDMSLEDEIGRAHV